MLATWDLGSPTLTGASGPGTSARESSQPSRPEDAAGCSQAHIDRKNGQTVIGECATRPDVKAKTALLAHPSDGR